MFIPVSREELNERGIDSPDFILISADAYVDHPSFGHALIARLTEANGFSVAIIPQPQTDSDYTKLGAPKIAFFIAGGVVDSMVNNYTVTKNKRTEDVYSEGGRYGKRPDRALTVYANKLKQLFPDVPIIAGGLEASLRRFAHYDYWSDSVMPSVLIDSKIDLLIYGMGEAPLLELFAEIKKGRPVNKLKDIKGTAYLTALDTANKKVAESITGAGGEYILLNSYERVKSDKKLYLKAFIAQSGETGNNPKGLIQKQDYTNYAVINPPALSLDIKTMDMVYALPFERKAHPMYKEGVPALTEVEFSITAHRGCYGNCAFCALTYHQGRAISKRSADSIISEAKEMTANPDFKGYIHDVGGPTANFHNPSCSQRENNGMCGERNCIGNKPCPNIKADHSEYLDILRNLRKLPGIKKVFIRSGIRFDYLMMDKDPAFFEELVAHHISGQLKVAPEHVSDSVLKIMNKPESGVYKAFAKKFKELNTKFKLNQFLVPYFISGHPGCTLADAIKLYEYLVSINYMPLQVQDFYPTPATRATTMFYTGTDMDGKPLYTAKTEEEKAMQRALMQYRNPKNRRLIMSAFDKAGRNDLKTAFLKKNHEK